jgi:hypothetical protein
MVESAEQALDCLVSDHFCVLITDLQLPDINGFELPESSYRSGFPRVALCKTRLSQKRLNELKSLIEEYSRLRSRGCCWRRRRRLTNQLFVRSGSDHIASTICSTTLRTRFFLFLTPPCPIELSLAGRAFNPDMG